MPTMGFQDIMDQLLRCSKIEDGIVARKKYDGDHTGAAYHAGRRDALRQFRDLVIDYVSGKDVGGGITLR